MSSETRTRRRRSDRAPFFVRVFDRRDAARPGASIAAVVVVVNRVALMSTIWSCVGDEDDDGDGRVDRRQICYFCSVETTSCVGTTIKRPPTRAGDHQAARFDDSDADLQPRRRRDARRRQRRRVPTRMTIVAVAFGGVGLFCLASSRQTSERDDDDDSRHRVVRSLSSWSSFNKAAAMIQVDESKSECSCHVE